MNNDGNKYKSNDDVINFLYCENEEVRKLQIYNLSV